MIFVKNVQRTGFLLTFAILILLQLIHGLPEIVEDENPKLSAATTTPLPRATLPLISGHDNNIYPPLHLTKRVSSTPYTLTAEFPTVLHNTSDSPVEILVHGNPGMVHNASFSNSGADGGAFITSLNRLSYCHYEARNFCVDRGMLLFFHDSKKAEEKLKSGLRVCNEFSRHSKSIYIKYWSSRLPNDASAVLPAPLNTVTKGWILQFWCQDLFHMTLTLLPAFHTSNAIGQPDPDVYVRIARGIRKDRGYCNVKLGDPRDFENGKNMKYGQDQQFPFAGNPYWSFYRILTTRPEKIHPLVPGQSLQSACYQRGVIDKRYIKDMTRAEAQNYSSRILELMKISPGVPRPCGSRYRLTMIDRRGRSRRLKNIPEIIELARSMDFEAQSIAFETIPIREQFKIITSTDILIGVHGNGLTWLQFLPPRSVVVELVGVWYTPYALLWGHSYFHSSIKNNLEYKRLGGYHPFAHNVSEVQGLLLRAMEALNRTRCGRVPFQPSNEKLADMYGSCVPHC